MMVSVIRTIKNVPSKKLLSLRWPKQLEPHESEVCDKLFTLAVNEAGGRLSSALNGGSNGEGSTGRDNELSRTV